MLPPTQPVRLADADPLDAVPIAIADIALGIGPLVSAPNLPTGWRRCWPCTRTARIRALRQRLLVWQCVQTVQRVAHT